MEDKSRQQNEIIEKQTYQLAELRETKDRLSAEIDNIHTDFKKRIAIGYVMGGIGVLLGVVSIFL
ncbi:MAG: hypothetical protein GX054_10605 [Clostridiales bacterium]|nr:hypothetical protein [Clostridiales bacterium]